MLFAVGKLEILVSGSEMSLVASGKVILNSEVYGFILVFPGKGDLDVHQWLTTW
ncbi:hypothetical protein [Calothrix sp. 336/3]|uniref:hypothetical protein n=1 Tax=Calothrix sp. 336/3 TaxID=1337936 RepID=UPI0030DC13F4